MYDVRGNRRPIESLERRLLLDGEPGTLPGAGDGEPPPTITPIHVDFGNGTPGRYTDPNGQQVVLQINGPGTGTLDIGPEPDRFTLVLNGTTAESSLVVKGVTAVGNTTVNGSLKSVSGRTAMLAGTLAVSGTLESVIFAASSGASGGNAINIAGADTPPLKVLIGRAADLSINTPGTIRSVSALTLVNEDSGFESINAAAIDSLKVRQNMDTGVQTTSGALGSAKIGGELSGFWSLAGGMGSLNCKGPVTGTWIFTSPGDVGSIKVQRFEGDLTANSLGSLKVAGDMNVGQVTITGGPLGALTVGGDAIGSQIRVNGDIGKVTVGSAGGTNFYAGVSPDTFELPESSGQLTGRFRIDSLTIRNGPYINSNVVADTLGKITVRNVQTDNQGVAFGVLGATIGQFTNVGKLKWKNGDDPALLQGEGDFIVQLLT
jgi:hypothetical protein